MAAQIGQHLGAAPSLGWSISGGFIFSEVVPKIRSIGRRAKEEEIGITPRAPKIGGESHMYVHVRLGKREANIEGSKAI